MAFMRGLPKPAGYLAIFLILSIIFLATPKSQAQFSDLRVTVGDTTAYSNETNTVISVYLDNFRHEIAGFNIWIQLDNPDIIKFQVDSAIVVDSTYYRCTEWDGVNCLTYVISTPLDFDSIGVITDTVLVGNHDVTGTLIEDWEYVDSRSLSGQGADINIAAFANMPAPPATPGILPQQGGLLVKILADVYNIPDTAIERTVNMMIQYEIVDHFNFSLPDGSSIGILYNEITDTSCWTCNIWCGSVCCDLVKVSEPPFGDYANCDSTDISLELSPYVDTDKIIIIDGSLTVLVTPECICGDINGDEYHLSDISDLTYMVDYIFGGGPEPAEFVCADVNSSGGTLINISDLTYLVNYLFTGGDDPVCTF